MVAKLRSFFPDVEWQIDDVLVDGDKVMVRSTVRGTPQASVLGNHVMVSDHRVEFMVIDVHQVRDGKIAHTWHVEDKMSVLTQFGIPHFSFR